MFDIEEFIDPSFRHYKGFDFIKKIASTNEEFAKVLKEALVNDKAYFFGSEIFDELRAQNIRTMKNAEDIFIEGYNEGGCTSCAIQLSYSYPSCEIAGGILTPIIGTKNSEDGRHTWIVKDKEIIDTSLMLVFDEKLAKDFGYNEENRYNPNRDKLYVAAKQFTNDRNLRKGR